MTQTKTRRPFTLADLNDREKRHARACFHEASHAAACVLLHGEVRIATVTNSRVFGVEGVTHFTHLPDRIDAAVTFAGIWGEARWMHGRTPTSQQLHAMRQHNGRDEARLRACTAEFDVYGGDTLADARRTVPGLLNRAWPAVGHLAAKLYRDGEVSHDDVLTALGITDGGGPCSSQLASLKAGLRSVPRSP